MLRFPLSVLTALHEFAQYGPRPLNSTQCNGHFVKSTCDMEPSDLRKNIRDTTWGNSEIQQAT